MNMIYCRIAGCSSKIETTERVATGATYLCSQHPRSVQVEAVGRVYDPVKDEADSEARFQIHQFDGALDRGGSDYEEPSKVSVIEGDIERPNA